MNITFFSEHQDALRRVYLDGRKPTEPWRTVRGYRKAAYPNDELREFACAEGLREESR